MIKLLVYLFGSQVFIWLMITLAALGNWFGSQDFNDFAIAFKVFEWEEGPRLVLYWGSLLAWFASHLFMYLLPKWEREFKEALRDE